uniref:Transmembrane protein 194A n=1 Tax=Lygus hesperus TaxID=30085 RepID=A0A0A9WCK4_LYGHE
MLHLLLCLILFVSPPAESATYATRELVENTVVKCCDYPRKDLNIYCYKGRPKHMLQIWETVQLQLSLSPDEYTHYMATTPEAVASKFDSDVSSWAVNIFSIKKKAIKLDPFNSTCVGIATSHHYDVKLIRIRVDYWRVTAFALGFLLFIAAPKLSSNSLFYYLTGMSVGTIASVLILVYILSRFVPKKPVMYSFLAGGWTVGLYMAQLVWDNIRTILVNYKMYVLYYALATGLISFIICYRIGPVTDPRSVDLIKWTLQAVALVTIFCSTDHQEAGMALAVIVFVSYHLRIVAFTRILSPFRKLMRWWNPELPKLLSEEEYYQQGAEETRRALDDLRGYCSSPECNQWKTVLRLKHPVRFAKFVQGASHLEDDEVLAFETEGGKPNASDDIITDDSSED